MQLPRPRGPLSAALVRGLAGPPLDLALPAASPGGDAAISLWTLQELHYRGFDGVDDRWEWQPSLLAARHALEDDLEQRLRQRWEAAGRPGVSGTDTADVAEAIFALAAADDGPSLARHVQRHASRDQVEQLLGERSLYHHKEADPTSWVVPRLGAQAKAALLEVQFDEYGNGSPDRLHHELWARGLAASGLDAAYGAQVDRTRVQVLEQNVALSMFGLRRALRGAALGHLAAFEATSSLPSRQLAQGLARLGFAPELVAYYDEHVEADAVHEQLAARAVCGALVAQEPHLRDDVLLGAWTCLDLEARTATSFLADWDAARDAA